MDRRHRLRRHAEIQATRRRGRWSRHALAHLAVRRNDLPYSRFCFSASRRVGNAVRRNRAKRLLREAVRLNVEQIDSGWDCVLVASPATADASGSEVAAAVQALFRQARLLQRE